MKTSEQIRDTVRRKYADIARSRPAGAAQSCCGGAGADAGSVNMIGDAYEGTTGYVAEADLCDRARPCWTSGPARGSTSSSHAMRSAPTDA
jgi:hypothetical protein